MRYCKTVCCKPSTCEKLAVERGRRGCDTHDMSVDTQRALYTRRGNDVASSVSIVSVCDSVCRRCADAATRSGCKMWRPEICVVFIKYPIIASEIDV